MVKIFADLPQSESYRLIDFDDVDVRPGFIPNTFILIVSGTKPYINMKVELAPRVRVNGVAPGAIAWPEDEQLDAAERSRILATTPLARLGAPQDVAQAVHFLASAPYVTGQIIAVDGGRSIYI